MKLLEFYKADGVRVWVNPSLIKWVEEVETLNSTNDECLVVFAEHEVLHIEQSGESVIDEIMGNKNETSL